MKQLLLSAIVLAAFGLPGAHALSPEGEAVLNACKPDIARFCGQVPPGEGRIKACMKSHLPELSEPCKEALFQAWLNR